MKKFGLSFLIILFFISFALPVEAASFSDVIQYKGEINYLTGKGIIKGYPEDNTFRPENPVFRMQAVQMIMREKNISADQSVQDPGFRDIHPGDDGYEAVAKAVELGIISGKTDPETDERYFDPYGKLTRQQMAKILSLAYQLVGGSDIVFKDVPINSEFHSYIQHLAANKITTGYENHTFKPGSDISRQHFAVFMARLLDDQFKPRDPLPIEGLTAIKLEMTKNEVKKTANGELFFEDSNTLMYRNKLIFGKTAKVTFNFENGKLAAINIFHDEVDNQQNQQKLETYFNQYLAEFNRVYGNPIDLDNDWNNDAGSAQMLSALWIAERQSTLLVVKLDVTDSSYGGIRISVQD